MKTGIMKSLLFFVAVMVVFSACRDRNAEKRIAELESRLAEVEGKKKLEGIQAQGTSITPAGSTIPGVDPVVAAPEESRKARYQAFNSKQLTMILEPLTRAT